MGYLKADKMTEKEALEYLESIVYEEPLYTQRALLVAMSTLKKQIPKKVNYFLEDDTFETTCCGIDVTNKYYKYCPDCGQLLGEVEVIEN